MEAVVGLVIAAMVLFAFVSGVREVILYRRALRGETFYLVSKQRRNRRLQISSILILEALFLFFGFFVVRYTTPGFTLLFWMPPLLLIGLLLYLSVQDFRETSHDLDQIVKESSEIILRKAREKLNQQSEEINTKTQRH